MPFKPRINDNQTKDREGHFRIQQVQQRNPSDSSL